MSDPSALLGTGLLLASRSPARIAMLEAAGVPFATLSVETDEEAAKQALLAREADARTIAEALAELKAVAASRMRPDALVLGCDSTVADAAGALVSKARDRADAARQLRLLAGSTHELHSAVVASRGGVPVWRHVATARLKMRDFSDAFLEAYLDREWPAIGGCVGGYRLEGLGVQLFETIEGDHFTILGLPLLALLGWLREQGLLPR